TYLHGKISQKDYEHAQKVWKEFNCKTLDDYHDLYLKIDVLSLADISPALAWDAMLKITGVKIELFTDISMHDFIEDAKRGGIAIAYKCYFKANNPKIGKTFNPSKPTTWISYVNANNLYGWVMSQYLLIGNYKWEVTVENMAVNKNMLSPYTTELVDSLDGGRFLATEKLVPYLGPQKEYVIHYLELQYYIELGMIVDEKDFFKLKNNSVYGKTIENVRKYQDVKLMAMNNKQDEKKFIKQIRKPSFKYARQLGNTLVEAHMGKASVTLNKPIIVEASVLGLSKLLMYRFWYRYVKERYGDKAQLGYMDTDSFIFQVETKDIYKDMAERPDLFDLNDSKTIGLFKDETLGNVITESYHIWAKSYHYVLADKSTKSKHKGVSKKGINEMAMNSYMPALEGSLLDDPIDRSLLSEQEAM
ncbi:30_t:CDS:2, partial [Cetraspora pellucida]